MVLEAGKPPHISQYYIIPIGDQENTDINKTKEDIFQAAELACNQVFDVELPSASLLSGGITEEDIDLHTPIASQVGVTVEV